LGFGYNGLMDEFIKVIDLNLQREPQCSREARSAIRAEIPEGPLRDSLEIIASELVTNAFVHGSGSIVCSIYRAHNSESKEQMYRIEVSNDVSGGELNIPTDRHVIDSEGGRGFGLVQSLSSEFGQDLSHTRLTVWAEVIHQVESH
jgi:anti-sigma regulatory factor (Ser/Thr protein kinase)